MNPKTENTSYLQHALQTEAFLKSNELKTDTGLTWKRVPEGKPTHTVYHGSAGVMLFYIELYLTTGDECYLTTAMAAGNQLLSYINQKIEHEAFITIGFYSGWPGYVYALNELYKVSKDERFRTGAVQALDAMTHQSSTIGSGIGWIEPIPFSDITGITGEREVIDLSVGAAGAGIIYLYAFREGLVETADLAIQTADRLLEVAEKTEHGLRWLMMTDMPFPFTAPNFAHGGAGVGYFLADLYKDTGEKRYLDAALEAARYVQSRAVAQETGCLVCHTEEQQPAKTFYLGVCHGPAGTGRLMYLLHNITGEQQYLDWLELNFAGLLGTGAPEVRSNGLWQNYGQCCGDAGIGDYALFLYKATGKEAYLEYARRTASYLLAASQQDQNQGLSWKTAEHRNRTDFLESQTGYMQGAAGVGSFLLHLANVEAGASGRKLVMPETPFA